MNVKHFMFFCVMVMGYLLGSLIENLRCQQRLGIKFHYGYWIIVINGFVFLVACSLEYFGVIK